MMIVILSCKDKSYQTTVMKADLQRSIDAAADIDTPGYDEIGNEQPFIDSKRNGKKLNRGSVSIPTDTTRYYIVDDFPVKDNMLGKEKNQIYLKSEKLRSIDKVWFINRDSSQVLVFELYTDKYHVETFLFPGSKIHPALLKRLSIHTEGESLATLDEKKEGINGLVDSAKRIASKYFITRKSIRLGDNKEKIIKAYGDPTKSSLEDDVEVLQWKFTGEYAYDGVSDLKGIPLAKNSFGHEAVAIFKEDHLIGLIFYNDIP